MPESILVTGASGITIDETLAGRAISLSIAYGDAEISQAWPHTDTKPLTTTACEYGECSAG